MNLQSEFQAGQGYLIRHYLKKEKKRRKEKRRSKKETHKAIKKK